MAKSEPDVCPRCGMKGVADADSCPNCTATVPKVRSGDLSPFGYVLLILACVCVGLMAGSAGLDDLAYIGIAVLVLVCIIGGVVSALKKRR